MQNVGLLQKLAIRLPLLWLFLDKEGVEGSEIEKTLTVARSPVEVWAGSSGWNHPAYPSLS